MVKTKEQEGKDVFEYSVFGSPNQKIGKFANQKEFMESGHNGKRSRLCCAYKFNIT